MTDKQKGILAMLISTFGFALMGVFIKLIGDIPVVQKVVFRTYIILITVFVMMQKYNVSLKGILHWRLLILRSALGTFGILLNYYAIDHLVLSDANVLFRLSTFFLLLFSWIFLGEKISLNQFITILIAFVGVLFIVKPQLDYNFIPYLISILGAMFAASAYTVVRALGHREQPLVIVFFFAAFTSIVLTPIAIVQSEPMSMSQIIYAILAGLSAAVGQVGVTYAYKHAPAKEISIYSYLGVVFAALFSIIIFNVVPDIFSFIGYIIIFITAFHMYKINTA